VLALVLGLFIDAFPPDKSPNLPDKDLECGRTAQVQHTVKTPLIGNIVDQQNPHCSPVIRRRDRAEPLLPRRIPYLQLDALAVELDGADLEVDANRRDEGRCERVFAKAQQAARFAYARVADEEELDLWSGQGLVNGL